MAELRDAERKSSVQVEKPVVSSTKKIDYARTLTWFLKDKRFGSVLLKGSLYILSCILILPAFYVIPVFVGFMLDIISNVQNGVYELPEEFGSERQWKDGAVLALISIAFSFILSFIFSFGAGSVRMGGSDMSNVENLLRNASHYRSGFSSFISSLLNTLFMMVTYAIYAKTREPRSLFVGSNYSSIFSKSGVNILIFMLISGAASTVLLPLGVLAFCIGIFPILVIVQLINSSLYGLIDVSEVE